MRDSGDFRHTIRRGAKAAAPTLVAHVASGTDGPVSVGFVVSKQVGGAVERNRVKRRLRHLVREHLDELPSGTRVVVRARPAAAGAAGRGARLGEDLDAALAAALRRSTRSGADRRAAQPVANGR